MKNDVCNFVIIPAQLLENSMNDSSLYLSKSLRALVRNKAINFTIVNIHNLQFIIYLL